MGSDLGEPGASALEEEWRPIETAPRDGTKILAIRCAVYVDPDTKVPEDVRAYSICWFTDQPGWGLNPAFFDGYHSVSPTHWAPLPPPPSSEAAAPLNRPPHG
jgi:hypothetical protein